MPLTSWQVRYANIVKMLLLQPPVGQDGGGDPHTLKYYV
jgi:hypothetical protein